MGNGSFCKTLLSMCLPHFSLQVGKIQVWIYNVPFWNMRQWSLTRNIMILSVIYKHKNLQKMTQ
jgi:hypothetical protein